MPTTSPIYIYAATRRKQWWPFRKGNCSRRLLFATERSAYGTPARLAGYGRMGKRRWLVLGEGRFAIRRKLSLSGEPTCARWSEDGWKYSKDETIGWTATERSVRITTKHQLNCYRASAELLQSWLPSTRFRHTVTQHVCFTASFLIRPSTEQAATSLCWWFWVRTCS